MIGDVLIVLVALIHVYIVILEMLLWDTERGRRAFGTTPAFAAQSRVMAANQGLYNAFLVAGLAWSLWPGGGGEPARTFLPELHRDRWPLWRLDRRPACPAHPGDPGGRRAACRAAARLKRIAGALRWRPDPSLWRKAAN